MQANVSEKKKAQLLHGFYAGNDNAELLAAATAVLAHRRSLSWNTKSSIWPALIQIAFPETDRKRTSELAKLMPQIERLSDEEARAFVKLGGGVDAIARGGKKSSKQNSTRRGQSKTKQRTRGLPNRTSVRER